MHMHAPTTETVSWSSGLTRSLVWPRGGSHRDRATRVSIDFMSSIRPTRPAGREVLPDDLLRFAHREPAVKRRRFTPSNHAISSMVSSPDSRKARAASFSGDIMVGRPPNPPRARAASSPARVRSSTGARSNSANAAKICSVKPRPPSSCPDPPSTIETRPRAAPDPRSSRSATAATDPTDPPGRPPACPPRRGA
jgi:hypothetical protein